MAKPIKVIFQFDITYIYNMRIVIDTWTFMCIQYTESLDFPCQYMQFYQENAKLVIITSVFHELFLTANFHKTK